MPTKPALEATPEQDKPKTFTNWSAFVKAKLTPVTISCEGYKPVFMADRSCHTKLLFTAQTLKNHVDADHGGGFTFTLKVTDGKPSPLWADLEALQMEAHDFRCDICDRILRFHPSAIIPHLKAHGGKTRRVYPGGRFNLMLSQAKPEEILLDEDEDNV